MWSSVEHNRGDDNWTWILDDKGWYSVSSAYQSLKHSSYSYISDVWKLIWKLKVPPKLRISCGG